MPEQKGVIWIPHKKSRFFILKTVLRLYLTSSGAIYIFKPNNGLTSTVWYHTLKTLTNKRTNSREEFTSPHSATDSNFEYNIQPCSRNSIQLLHLTSTRCCSDNPEIHNFQHIDINLGQQPSRSIRPWKPYNSIKWIFLWRRHYTQTAVSRWLWDTILSLISTKPLQAAPLPFQYPSSPLTLRIGAAS